MMPSTLEPATGPARDGAENGEAVGARGSGDRPLPRARRRAVDRPTAGIDGPARIACVDVGASFSVDVGARYAGAAAARVVKDAGGERVLVLVLVVVVSTASSPDSDSEHSEDDAEDGATSMFSSGACVGSPLARTDTPCLAFGGDGASLLKRICLPCVTPLLVLLVVVLA